MLKKIIPILFLFLLMYFGFTDLAQAQETLPNNSVGVHLNQPEENDIKKATELVNSAGGKWGYVTIVIQRNDQNIQKWNEAFNLFRKHHLIPIVRLATEPCGATWCIPTNDDAQKWADFLGKLRWPIKQRYVVLYNEPNHANEWGGTIDPGGYASIAKAHLEALRGKSVDFIPLLAGFDSAAPNGPATMDQITFWKKITESIPDFFTNFGFDCIASHSYPNHGYVGRPTDKGRNSVVNYEWELQQLKKLGVTKDVCVMITETGWPHKEGSAIAGQYYSSEKLSQFYQTYYDRILKGQVKASTIFTLKDCGQFEHFSMIDCATQQFYPYVNVIKIIPKTAGEPEQKQLFNVSALLPKEMTVDSTYSVIIKMINGGQAWIDVDDGYRLHVIEGSITGAFSTIIDMQPGTSKTLAFSIKTGGQLGEQCAKVGLYKDEKLITELFKWCFTVSPQPGLDFTLGRLIKTSGLVEVQFFDKDEQLVFKQKTDVTDTGGHIDTIKNVIIGDMYRVVIVKDFFLPAQKFIKIKNGSNTLQYDALAPIDFNNDGQFTLADILAIRKRLMNK